MDITRTIKVRLILNNMNEGSLLNNMLKQYAAACDFVSQYVFDNGFELNSNKLSNKLSNNLSNNFASEKRIPGKWRRQECDYSSIAMNNRITTAMDRLACSRSASSRFRNLFS